ncbi:MAG: hypothetical protein QOJ73_1854 [Streptosporangiaceae bacterium]|nr:hypothetical protein [Streptosporangiaceae bacterium]
MSEQVSGTHGPAEDDAIKRQDRSELQAHGEEWPEPESPGEDEPAAIWAPEGRFAGTRPGEGLAGHRAAQRPGQSPGRATMLAALVELTASNGAIFGALAAKLQEPETS